MYYGDKQLYVVKRANVEEYQCGFHSYVAPKLYFKPWATTVCNAQNKRREQYYTKPFDSDYYDRGIYNAERIEEFRKMHEQGIKSEAEKGPWVVVAVNIIPVSVDNTLSQK